MPRAPSMTSAVRSGSGHVIPALMTGSAVTPSGIILKSVNERIDRAPFPQARHVDGRLMLRKAEIWWCS